MLSHKTQYDVYNQHCASRKVLEIISDKWVILIISTLTNRILRFGELRREVGGISQKVLTETLRSLEKHGFVFRNAYPVLPQKVEYSLTPLGESLSGILNLITQWAQEHIEEITSLT